LERRIPVRQGLRFQQLPEILAKRIDVLSPRIIKIIEDLSADWRIEEIEVLADGTESCRQLMTVPGIGAIIASAQWSRRLAMASLLLKGVILPPGCVTIIFTLRSKSIVPVW
jgi:hypothetical protein